MPRGIYERSSEDRVRRLKALGPFSFKKGHRAWNKGVPASEEVKQRFHSWSLSRAVLNQGKTFEEIYGQNRAEEIRKRMSSSHKDHIPWNKGLSAKTSGRVRKCVKGMILAHKSNPDWATKSSKIMTELHKNNPEYHDRVMALLYKGRDALWADPKKKALKLEKHREAMMKGMHIKPNKPEKAILALLENYYPSQWKYTGDGSFFLDRLCPDFVNVNGKKQIIEVFGDYWHGERARTYREEEEGRIAAFAQYGYSTLVIWERELANMSLVLQKIANFVGPMESENEVVHKDI